MFRRKHRPHWHTQDWTCPECGTTIPAHLHLTLVWAVDDTDTADIELHALTHGGQI